MLEHTGPALGRFHHRIALGAAAAAALLAPATAGAAAMPDPSFGTGGRTVITVPHADPGRATALRLPGGGLLTVGGLARTEGILLTRLTPGGALDRRFGEGGTRVVTSNCGIGDGRGSRLNSPRPVRLSDGRIVLPCEVVDGGAIRRSTFLALTAEGRIDRSYGRSGTVDLAAALRRAHLSYRGLVRVLLPRDGGRLLLALRAGTRTALVQLTRQGRPDPRFGRGGIVTQAAPADQLLPRSGGRVVVAGATSAAVRLTGYTAAGRLERSFGRSGSLVAMAPAGKVFLSSDGTFTVAALERAPGRKAVRFSVSHFRRDGRLDTRFGEGSGRVSSTTALPGIADLSMRPGVGLVERQPGGAYVLAGAVIPPFSPDAGYGDAPPSTAVALRFTSSGAPDTSFGDRGVLLLPAVTPAHTDGIGTVLAERGTVTLVGGSQVKPGEIENGRTVLFADRYLTGPGG